MGRHIADKNRSTKAGRLKNFVEVEKSRGDAGSHPATQTLHGRPKDRDDTAKLREYLRIERDQTG